MSLTPFPTEVHHYTTASTRRFEQFHSSAHNQPLTFLPSVCPYSMVTTGHHSKTFVSTYSKTLRHGGRSLTMILVTKSFLGTSAFHHFTQQHPPTLPSCLLLPHVAAWADFCQHLQQDFKTWRQEPRHDTSYQIFPWHLCFSPFCTATPTYSTVLSASSTCCCLGC
jgi:hypothetical protein